LFVGTFVLACLQGVPKAGAKPFEFKFSLGGSQKARPARPQPRPAAHAFRPTAPAPAASAPAAAAAPGGRAAPRTNVAWVDELPTAAAVIGIVRSSTPWDEAARESAALRSLADYVAGQISLTKNAPSLALSRQQEYLVFAKGKGDEYYWTEAWHDAVLASFIDPAIAAAYKATPAWQAQLAPIRARQATQKASRDAESNRTAAAVAAMLEHTAKGKTDRTVFGIKLGEPLALPTCPENSRPANNCLKSQAAPGFNSDPFGALAQGLESWVDKAATTGGVTPPGMQQSIVILGTSRCPNWVTCQVVVTTKDGLALAATFQTSLVRKLTGGDVLDDVARSLFEKYHVKPMESGASECHVSYGGVGLGTSDRAKDWQWSPPGLSVHYTTYGNPTNCNQGRVDVQSEAFSALVQQHAEQEQAAQPKM
jgi:hypothetical protein